MVRKRTGLRTLGALVQKICELNAKYSHIIVTLIPADKLVYYTALTQACDDFVNNVNIPEILNDESP